MTHIGLQKRFVSSGQVSDLLTNNISLPSTPVNPARTVSVLPSAFESIETTTISTGGIQAVTFSSLPTNFKHLQIRTSVKDDALGVNQHLRLQFNSDTGANYHYHNFGWASASFSTSNEATSNYGYVFRGSLGNQSDYTNGFAHTIIDIFDYLNTSYYKNYKYMSGFMGTVSAMTSGTGSHQVGGGAWRNTNAITSITINGDGADFRNNSVFALYGVK